MGQTQTGKSITATHNARNDRDGHELGHFWNKLTMGTWGKIALPGRIGKASHRSLDGEFLAHLLLGQCSACARNLLEDFKYVCPYFLDLCRYFF